MIILDSIYRYPIKGFPGERLSQATLRPNEGIEGDRAMAISSGVTTVNRQGAWSPCQAFQRMTIRPDLTTFKVDNSPQGTILTSPDGTSEMIDGNVSNLGALSELFQNHASLFHAAGNRGYWDHEDAAISIINLSTVDAIAEMAKRPVDPMRFRANLYIRAEPWSEFNWLNHQLKIGNTTLAIIRPIDRCKATSVDIETGKVDLDVPALLIRHFGHMYCGVYATVHSAGTLQSSNPIEILNRLPNKLVADAASIDTAPALYQWPRSAKIIKTKNEAEGIRSIWIQDSLERLGSLADFKAGQYIRLHNISDTHTWRSYTVSGVKDDQLRITVKLDKGVGSQAMHQVTEGETMTITGPFGEASLDDDSNAIHFISAGIGITPTAIKLTELAKQGYCRPVHVTHVARNQSQLALWDDIVAAKNELLRAHIDLYLTQDTAEQVQTTSGRPDLKDIADRVKTDDADVHVCGPAGFVEEVINNLAKSNVKMDNIFLDTFSSPDIETKMRSIPDSAPIKVTLAKSNITDFWNPDDGTLLDFAEARGAAIPSHCRAGLCKTCRCDVLDGSATRLIGEQGKDKEQTLVCSSIPAESLVLDI